MLENTSLQLLRTKQQKICPASNEFRRQRRPCKGIQTPMYSFRTLLRTFLHHISLMFIYWTKDHRLLKKSGLENLEQLLYLCIFWFWILIKASNYQLYMFLNSTLLPYPTCNFLSIRCDFTWWRIEIVYPPRMLYFGEYRQWMNSKGQVVHRRTHSWLPAYASSKPCVKVRNCDTVETDIMNSVIRNYRWPC